MKKNILAVAVIGALAAGSAFAEEDNVGCGVGSIIFEGQSGVAPQVLAVTTNGTLGNQTFGISSGTLGCTQDGVVTAQNKLPMFTDANLDKLARDIAVGQGESLETLAALMGVADEHKPRFFQTTKDHFDTIFPSENVTAQNVLDALDNILAQDTVLAPYAG